MNEARSNAPDRHSTSSVSATLLRCPTTLMSYIFALTLAPGSTWTTFR